MKNIDEIYQRYERRIALMGGDPFTALDYGPAHIVWDDRNFDTDNIQWCIDHTQEHRNNLSDVEVELVVESLKALLDIPEEIRMAESEAA